MNKINLNIGDALIELKKIKSSSVDLIIAYPHREGARKTMEIILRQRI